MSLVKINQLTVDFPGVRALDNVSMDIESGRIVGLLGTNGSGKSTLIKVLNELLVPTSGGAIIDGHNPGIESKKVVSYLPERTYLDPNMNAIQAVDMFSDYYPDFNKTKALDLLNRLEINTKARFATLSKGNKEKVQLILVMSRDAKLYILDEPIAGVDPATRDFILETILRNRAEGSSILLCTHLIYDIQDILEDVFFLNRGKIVLAGKKEEIEQKYNKSVDQVFREEFKWF